MTRLSVIAVLTLALGLTAACGGKNKAKKTTPGDTTGSGDTGTGGGDTNTNAAANLGEIIYFEFDSSDLTADARNTLEQNAAWLREDANRVLTIEGHTDEVGTPAYNLALGERRAIAAKDYLKNLGIDEKRVSIITYGEEKPAGTEDNLNRRSVFISSKK